MTIGIVVAAFFAASMAGGLAATINIDACSHQVGRECGKVINPVGRQAGLNYEIPTFDVSEIA